MLLILNYEHRDRYIDGHVFYRKIHYNMCCVMNAEQLEVELEHNQISLTAVSTGLTQNL